MNKKIITISLVILFALILILLNVFLNSQNKVNMPKGENKIDKINSEVENKIEKITNSNFESEVLNSEKTVLIDFYATWCMPCKILSPIIEEIANENTEIKVVKIDIDEEEDLAIKYKVISIPTIVVIKDGKEINRIVGVTSKSEILKIIQQ